MTKTKLAGWRAPSIALIAITMLALTIPGCTTVSFPSDSDAKPVTGLPDHFVFESEQMPVAPAGDGACRSPLADPRDGTRIYLVRSADGRGDYDTQGRYGIGNGALLRIDCGTGQPVGSVRR